MKSFLIALVCLAVVGELALAGRSSLHEWTQYKRQHGKSYDSQAEDARRFANFMATKERVERHNAQANSSYKMGLNHMSDWSPEERAQLNGLKVDAEVRQMQRLMSAESDAAHLAKILASSDEPIPDELDWRQTPGRVTPVKNQGKCGSCWAFASIGALEGQELTQGINKTGGVPLSEQELLDCSKLNWGCEGGLMSNAFDDIKELGGVQTGADYPYIAKNGTCKFQKEKVVITDAGHTSLPFEDEGALKEVLAKFGPVTTAMQVTTNLADYKSGVFKDDECGNDLNHAILLVGYGTGPQGGDYWLVKNSWSDKWGDKGYFKIARGVGMCGIGDDSVIPNF